MGKPWLKAKHKRKAFNSYSVCQKLYYYMHPFFHSIAYTWYQPLPYPSLLKFGYISVTLALMMSPVFYFLAVLATIYFEIEYFYEKVANVEYPECYSSLKLVNEVFYEQANNIYYQVFVVLYFERLRMVILAFASTIDYIRLAVFVLTY